MTVIAARVFAVKARVAGHFMMWTLAWSGHDASQYTAHMQSFAALVNLQGGALPVKAPCNDAAWCRKKERLQGCHQPTGLIAYAVSCHVMQCSLSKQGYILLTWCQHGLVAAPCLVSLLWEC